MNDFTRAYMRGYKDAQKEALMSVPDGAQPAVAEQHKQRSVSEHLEPVAWLHWLHGPARLFLNKDEAMLELDRLNREYPEGKDARQMKPLYTTPPQRTAAEGEDTKAWVGLTDAQITALWETRPYFNDFAKAIEAKLKAKNERKEKNNGS